MHRFIHSGISLIVLSWWPLVPAIAEQLSSDKSLTSLDASSSSLDGHRLFFSVQERKKIQPTAVTSKVLEVDQQPLISTIDVQKKLSVRATTTSTPLEEKKLIHYQALLESESALRLIINGIPCEVATVLSVLSSVDRVAVDCQSATLSSVNLTWFPATRMLQVERSDGAVSLLPLGGYL